MKRTFTERIFLKQGVPQGDIISPYIFILAVDILLIKINFSKHIKGIVFAKHEPRSETFVDGEERRVPQVVPKYLPKNLRAQR